MPATIFTAQCPHCQEKLHWGETSHEVRTVPDRCPLCFEPLSAAEQERMHAEAEISLGEDSFHLPAEG